MPKRSNHEIMRTKLTPVLRPGEWGVFKARLTHALVRRTVRDSRFTRLTPAQLIALLREKLKPKAGPPPPPPPPPPPRVDAETKAAVALLMKEALGPFYTKKVIERVDADTKKDVFMYVKVALDSYYNQNIWGLDHDR